MPVVKDSTFSHDCAAGRRDKIPEQRLGESVTGHTFGMPLDSDHPIGIAGPLDAFDDSIRSLGGHTKVFAGCIDRLVVAAINPCHRSLIESGQPAVGTEIRLVLAIPLAGAGQEIRGAVRYRAGPLDEDVLNQGALEMNVQNLATIANGQNRL